ncbi:hypothetical protein Q7O_002703 [Pectobacterium carotovorum subsp. carotovorum PCCS1]|nr:hypothetical protein [Pectobacterium carotovorum subsp. carotovorum PCCS1]
MQKVRELLNFRHAEEIAMQKVRLTQHAIISSEEPVANRFINP